ncbi:cytochrome c oxidase subunit 5A, mitochondrial [Apis mellifera caucasica]|uniref:Cytochrome c oxidase subunit 5A, mitochondrial n=1 Tax=Apis mellifera TaxID=7460 RepID=A0A7M7R4R1_APIME|nr:cytochrome c oxidase subunit 5A, mitochondrial [Apis mellifera]KAG6799228.1 cytochrome c oxidase subunit 5A, mitochondrial [Apis mellifera caucasica]KAG9433931.1 cytochrome c oxidase subunit 5A, mitochondrial [Apis mellifera carnica]|eukprot:XP_392368.1 cytochrome c oxidase subunit 5A, mitochondrial [Apis mellifera]
MLRFVGKQINNTLRNSLIPYNTVIRQNIRASHDGPQETEEEFNKQYVTYLNRTNLDHWEFRQAMNKLAAMDLVPDPSIICAALRACRRLNDFALAIRVLEMIKDKCGSKVKEIYPYILQEIKPTLDELGINTIEELGYDKPELALQSIDDIH